MSTKPTKEKKTLAGGKAVPSKVDKKPTKSAKADEDDDLEDDELDFDTPKAKKSAKGKTTASKSKDDDDDDDADEDVADDWEKVEEEEEWDPDFEEFDLPKSKGKKSPGKKPTAVDEDEDFKIDDEFKDIFNDSDAGFDDEDDDF